MAKVKVHVFLKPGVLDVQGKAVEGALQGLGWAGVSGARVGKPIGLKGPTYLQRQGVTRVEPRAKTGVVPAGARSMQVTLTGSRTGAGPCGFVDNVSAVLVSAPTGSGTSTRR